MLTLVYMPAVASVQLHTHTHTHQRNCIVKLQQFTTKHNHESVIYHKIHCEVKHSHEHASLYVLYRKLDIGVLQQHIFCS